jgi:hypothetical protein
MSVAGPGSVPMYGSQSRGGQVPGNTRDDNIAVRRVAPGTRNGYRSGWQDETVTRPYFITGMVNSVSLRIPVGQRAVMVFMRV